MTKHNNPRLEQPALWGGYSREGSPNSVFDCYFQRASDNPDVPQIWAYTSELSYAPEGQIQLHVNTMALIYDVLIYRDGAKRQVIYERQSVQGVFNPTPANCSITGCDWPVSLEIPINPTWASGAYIVELGAVAPDGSALNYQHVFLLRPSVLADKQGRLLLVAATGTWTAYNDWGGCAPRGAGGFTIYRPEHWAFANCDIYYGDVLGAGSRVFAYEVDGVDHIIKDGLPFATGTDGAPEGLLILAVGLATVFEADHGHNDKLFIAADDAEFIARTTYESATPQTVDRCKRGSGMIAIFERGDGCVFTAGSCEWVAGLIDRDPQVELVTKNVLNRFLGAL